MPWTPDAVFATDVEAIDEARELLKEYRFRLKDIRIPITIRLFKVFGSDAVHFDQSHFIHTPGQAGPYMTSRTWNDDLGSALHQVVFGITQYYNQAVKAGHKPSPSWLVTNKNF